MKKNGGLDSRDWLIIEELQANARLKMKTLADRANLSLSATTERVKRLEHLGVVCGYGARVNPLKCGYRVAAQVLVKVEHLKQAEAKREIVKIPEVVEAFFTTGEYYMTLKVFAESTDHLKEVLENILKFGETRTALVLDHLVQRPVSNTK